MRSLLALPLAFVLAATASAQSNQSTVTQAGGAMATVVQGGSGLSGSGHNVAVVDQRGASTATVMQSGDLNLADIGQNGAGNTAMLIQAGTDNDGLIYQGQTGTKIQIPVGTASGNTAHLEQSGRHNRGLEQNILSPLDAGIIYQGVRGGLSTGNTSTVTQRGDNGQAWSSQGDINGTAIGNTARIDQSGVNNDASTVQGYYNLGLVEAQGSTAEITQVAGSANNDAYVYQGMYGTSENDRATITQTGHFDLTIIRQGSFMDLGAPESYVGRSSGNVATVSQGGAGSTNYSNRATVLQGVNGGEAVGNDATVEQFAGTFGNTALVYQGVETLSTGSHAFVYQHSSGNAATITQSGTANTATTTQN